jgi:signal transduction histidine kinase
MQVPDDSETAIALDSALEEVDRLQHLSSRLLVLARTRAAGPAPDRAFELRESAARAVQDAVVVQDASATRHPGSGPAPRVHIEGAATARGDAEALERAVRNLVENALRHARTEVVVRITLDGDWASLVVADDGPGFQADLLEHGVDRFTPGDSPEAHGGAGLGLAIVNAIVRAHDGTLELRNREPSGAVVEIRLPASPDSGG